MRSVTLALFMLLAACSTSAVPVAGSPASDPLVNLANFTVADLTAADADAVAHNDVLAHACYPALIQFVKSNQPAAGANVAGAFSAFQKGRDLVGQVNAGLPTYLVLGCAPLVADVRAMAIKLAAIGVGTAATAGAILPIPVLPLP
jgi:hypothetical protein